MWVDLLVNEGMQVAIYTMATAILVIANTV